MAAALIRLKRVVLLSPYRCEKIRALRRSVDVALVLVSAALLDASFACLAKRSPRLFFSSFFWCLICLFYSCQAIDKPARSKKNYAAKYNWDNFAYICDLPRFVLIPSHGHASIAVEKVFFFSCVLL